MSILNVGSAAQSYGSAIAQAKAEKARAEEEKKPQSAKVEEAADEKKNQDTFTKSGSQKPVTYSKNELTSSQVQKLKDDAQQRIDSFRMLLEKMLVKQGEKANLALFGRRFHVSSDDGAAAAASIAEGGEYSVDAVATRIMDMAKALSGGDESKIAALRGAVEKGFKAAGVKLGSKLPGVCKDTYTEVMKRFDDWEKGGETAAGSK